MMRYTVLDACGQVLRSFRTEAEAKNFRMSNHRYDWTIIQNY
jgi:hypothetical protein